MNRSLIVNAVFMLVALGIAYGVWTAGKPSKVDKPTLVELDADAITGITYTWPEGRTELTPEGEGEARSYLVQLEREDRSAKKTAAKPSPSEDGGVVEDGGAAVPEPKPARVRSRFPAGASVQQAVAKLAPLQALRSLGTWETERLEKMGLTAPERILEVQAGARSFVLELGAKTYGAQGHYAQLRGKPEVYLVPTALVNGFEGSQSRLMEWRLMPARPEEIVEVGLRQGTRLQRLLHIDREQPAKRHYALASAPEQKSEEAAGLVNRLRGLRASKYRSEEPAPDSISEVAGFTVQRADSPPVELTLYELADGSGYLVRSGRWLAEVNAAQASGLVEDLGGLLPE